MNEQIIKIRNLTKKYGNGKGVFNINLDIPRGKVFGLLGRNGAGKSTLLKSLVGLVLPGEGNVEIMNLDYIKNNQEILSRTGFVDEQKILYDWMTIDEIIKFTSSFYTNWDDGLVDSMLKEFNLNREQKIGNLSRGQKAEISLLLALAFHPELLILDEPASGLDIIVRHEFMEKFIQFACIEGTSIIISSHILEDVERICDEVAFIEEGKLIFHTEMEILRDEYKKYLETEKSEIRNFSLKDIFISTVKDNFRVGRE